MSYQNLSKKLEDLESKIHFALYKEINKSNRKSKFIDTKALQINLFDYCELVNWDGNLRFLDSNGNHYSVDCEATLYDLVDILNSI